jgi:serine/threonine protein kinase
MVKTGSHHIKLIDFGLADTLTVRKANTLIGNVRFCSRLAHFGNSSKKDDLESLMILLYYLMTGSVPWQSASKE